MAVLADVPEWQRNLMLRRDDWACAATGDTTREALTVQHRQRVGMGGDKRSQSMSNLLTLRGDINERCEHDLQDVACAFGWKVPTTFTPDAGPDVEAMHPGIVPVRYFDGRWLFLREGGLVFEVNRHEARSQMIHVYGRNTYLRWAREAQQWLLEGKK